MYFPTMDLAALLNDFGYLAVVLVTLIGGQAIVPLAGFLAQQGYLNPLYVGLSAFGGSLACNQGLFFLARYRGASLLRRFPRLSGKLEAFGCRVRKHQVVLMLIFPFLYGFRNITPLFLGLTKAEPRLFFPLNCIAASAWAAAFTALGYFFGKALDPLAGHNKHFELYVMAGILLLGVVAWTLRQLMRKKQRKACRK